MVDIRKEILISEKEYPETNYEKLKTIELYRKQFDRF